MKIEQFEDKGLAHFSYAVLGEDSNEIILVDPARDPKPYFEYAASNKARIIGVIETHPHADFVGSHLEIHQTTGATIYVSKLVGADYPHQAYDEGDVIEMGEVRLRALYTPGHSPDGISVVAEEWGKDHAVFTGDTLFINDVGRPDLREEAGGNTAQHLARQMYTSIREKLMKLDNEVIVYPAHGAGSLCGKTMSNAKSSTIGAEKTGNYALQPMPEEDFVKILLEEPPFIPKYFGYNVRLNKQGAPSLAPSLAAVKRNEADFIPAPGGVVIDGRPQAQFKEGHIQGAINIQNGEKFETWLGSIVGPEEKFYLVAASENELRVLLEKASKIGYELLVAGAFVYNEMPGTKSRKFDKDAFEANKTAFTVIDIRNGSETKNGTLFDGAMTLPLPELRERAHEIPTGKPVVVHCSGGYRSAAGSSILEGILPVDVLDMGENVKELSKSTA